MPITYTSGEQVEVYRFSIPVTIGVPLLALFIQAFIPLRFPGFAAYFDLPLLVTIFFAMARRNPISGLFTGALIGLVQDMLGHNKIGLYGIAKTIVGYLASSIGARLDTEHPAARFALTILFFGVHQGILVLERRILLAQPEVWFSLHLAIAALINAVVGVFLFVLLDRLRKPS